MNLDDKEDLRLQIITDMIGYLDLSIKFDPTADLVEKPNDLKTEVFDVISVNKRSFSAAPIWEETEPINIHCPRVLIELLKKGDTFFMTIGKFGTRWQLLDTGPPYFSVDIQEELNLEAH